MFEANSADFVTGLDWTADACIEMTDHNVIARTINTVVVLLFIVFGSSYCSYRNNVPPNLRHNIQDAEQNDKFCKLTTKS